MRYCWLIRRTPDSMLWERVSSKATTGFLRALTVVFNADFQSVFALTNRVSCGQVHEAPPERGLARTAPLKELSRSAQPLKGLRWLRMAP